MKYEYGTGEVILLQILDYFHQKAVELEGAAYRANELKKIYDALNKDYVQKCEEYDALNKTYDKLAEDYETEIAELKEELNMVSKSNNEMLDKLTIAHNQNYCNEQDIRRLKQALDERMTECDELKSEIFILEGLIKKGNVKIDEAKIADIIYGDLNKATTPISSEEVDILAHMAGWEKAGY